MNAQLSGQSVTLVTVDGGKKCAHLRQRVVQDIGVVVAVGNETLEKDSPI